MNGMNQFTRIRTNKHPLIRHDRTPIPPLGLEFNGVPSGILVNFVPVAPHARTDAVGVFGPHGDVGDGDGVVETYFPPLTLGFSFLWVLWVVAVAVVVVIAIVVLVPVCAIIVTATATITITITITTVAITTAVIIAAIIMIIIIFIFERLMSNLREVNLRSYKHCVCVFTIT